jgi:hypothetical protein
MAGVDPAIQFLLGRVKPDHKRQPAMRRGGLAQPRNRFRKNGTKEALTALLAARILVANHKRA